MFESYGCLKIFVTSVQLWRVRFGRSWFLASQEMDGIWQFGPCSMYEECHAVATSCGSRQVLCYVRLPRGATVCSTPTNMEVDSHGCEVTLE